MVFNEYADILDDGDVYFLDEENLFQIMLEDGEPKPKTPTGLGNNDSTASSEEKKQASSEGTNNGDGEKAKNTGRRLLDWWKAQSSSFNQFAKDQMGKVNARYNELKQKVEQMPKDYNGDEEVEIPTKGVDPTPKMGTNVNGDNPEVIEQERVKFTKRVSDWIYAHTAGPVVDAAKTAGGAVGDAAKTVGGNTKKVVKGAGMVMAGAWLIKQLQRFSGELDVNFKTGQVYMSAGMGKASQAANGNGFASALGTVIKNVFLALLVLIGGIFKVLKEYLLALGKIIGTVFKTVGQAGQTLVTGQMPSKA